MFERTHTLLFASPPTAMMFAMSSAGAVLINELTRPIRTGER